MRQSLYLLLLVACCAATTLAWPLHFYGNKIGNDSSSYVPIKIFDHAISLNEHFKRASGISVNSLNALRIEVENYDDKYVSSARKSANRILRKKNDSLLLCTYLRYVISYENSAEEAIDWDIAAVFIDNPALFFRVRSKFSKRERNLLKKAIDFGLQNWRYEGKYGKQQIDSAAKKLKKF